MKRIIFLSTPTEKRAALATAFCGGLSIFGFVCGLWFLGAGLKILTTIVIIAFAYLQMGGWRRTSSYGRIIFTGLCLSFLGDVFLIFPQGFLAGLGAFLLAHCCYIVAFTNKLQSGFKRAPFLFFACAAGLAMMIIVPHTPGAMKIAVCIYACVISAMAALATSRFMRFPDRGSWLASIGASIFVASDLTLAIDKFVTAVPLAPLWILGLYWLAQFLIALSIPKTQV